jgi:hypothetical protein
MNVCFIFLQSSSSARMRLGLRFEIVELPRARGTDEGPDGAANQRQGGTSFATGKVRIHSAIASTMKDAKVTSESGCSLHGYSGEQGH